MQREIVGLQEEMIKRKLEKQSAYNWIMRESPGTAVVLDGLRDVIGTRGHINFRNEVIRMSDDPGESLFPMSTETIKALCLINKAFVFPDERCDSTW